MADKDFVVKNGLVVNTNLIYADGSSNRVGINNSSPDASLTVTGTANVSGNVSLTGANVDVTSHTTFTGNVNIKNTAVVDTRLYVGNTTNMVPLGGLPIIQAVDTRNSFVMISSQNLSKEDDSCADLLIYADNTGGLTHFNDLGINNSRFDGTLHRVSANTTSDSFILGETLFQSNGTANIAVGVLRDRTVINSTSRSLKISVLETDGVWTAVGSPAFSNTTGANLSIRGVTSGANADVLVAVQYGEVSDYSRRNYPFTIGKRGDGYLYNANSALTIGTTAGGLRVDTKTISVSAFSTGANSITLSTGNTDALYADMILSGTSIPVGTYITSVTNSTSFKISKTTTGSSSGSYTLTDPFYDAAGNPIIFHVNGMSSNDEVMRLSGNGNLTIGNNTISRSDKLTVAGTANVTGNVALGNNMTIAGNIVASGNVSSPVFKSGANVVVNTSTVFVGNSTANADIISSLVQVSNSTSVANLTAADLKIGAVTTVNSTQVVATLHVGNVSGSYANITGQVNTSTLYAATSANIASATVANATGVWTTGTVNAAVHMTGAGFGAATPGIVVNSTAIGVSSNTTVNSIQTATLLQVANSTSSANLTSADLKIGAVTTVNSSQVTATLVSANLTGGYANISGQVNTSTLYAATSANVASATLANATGVWTSGTVNAAAHTTGTGYGLAGASVNSTAIGVSSNSTVNASVAPALIQIANSTSAANLTPIDLKIGGTTVVNTTQVTATLVNANLTGGYANISGQVNTTTLYAVTSANIASAVQANSTGVYTTGNVNIGSAANGIYISPTVATIGNSSVNATINSTLYTATANNTQYVGVTAAAAVVNTAQLQGNLALYQTLSGLQANVIKITANDSAYFANQLPSYYQNATNMNSGTLPAGRLAGAYTGITGTGTLANLTVTGNVSLNNFTLTSNSISNVVTIVSSNVNIDAGTLFVDSINNRVGINSTTPNAELYVQGNANISGNLAIGGNFSVIGTFTYTGTSVAEGAFVPSINGLELGNTTNRWHLLGTNATLTGALVAPQANLSANLNIGSNLTINTSSIYIGNATVYTAVNSSYVDMTGVLNVANQAYITANVKVGSGVVNSYVNATAVAFVNSTATAIVNATNYTGTANNAANFNGQPASFYANGDNITTGTVASARLPQGSPTVFGAVQVVDSITNTSATATAAANSVKNAYDRAIDANTRAASAQTMATAAYTNAVNYVTAQPFATTTQLTANAATAYNNAVAFAANADNISSGTLAYARIPSAIVNTSGNFTIGGVATHTANISISANINITNGVVSHTIYANTTNAYFTGIALNANNAATVGGNTAATLRAYSDTMAATAYSNAVTYASDATNLTTGTIAYARIPANIINTTASFIITGTRSYSANLTTTANVYTTANLYFSNGSVTQSIFANTTNVYFTGLAYRSLYSTNSAAVDGNTALDLRTYSETMAATAYSNGVTFASNATNISTGTIGYSIIPTNIVNTSHAFTISAVHTHSANIVMTANMNFTNSTVTQTIYANTSNVYFTGIALNANNAALVGGNSALDLRNYTDTKAAAAYTNVIALSYANTSQVTSNAATAYTNAVAYTDGRIIDSVTNTSIAYAAAAASVKNAYDRAIDANTRAASAQSAAIAAYSNAITYGANASTITSGTLAYSIIPTNIVNTTAAFTISGVHTHSGDISTSANIVFTNASITKGTLYANSLGAYFSGISLNAWAANSAAYVGTLPAANVVSNAQLVANLANYVNTTSVAYDSSRLGGVLAANYLLSNQDDTTSGTLTASGFNLSFTAGAERQFKYVMTDRQVYFYGQDSAAKTVGLYDTTAGIARWYANSTGAFVVYNDITAFASDARIKTDVKPIANALNKVAQINGVQYRHNEFGISKGFEDKEHVGVIAQEIEKVLPQVIAIAPFDDDGTGKSKSGENYLTVKYDKIVPLLIEAIKELNGKVESLTKELLELKK